MPQHGSWGFQMIVGLLTMSMSTFEWGITLNITVLPQGKGGVKMEKILAFSSFLICFSLTMYMMIFGIDIQWTRRPAIKPTTGYLFSTEC